MADKVSKKRRSEIMRSVKGKDTKPEMIVRKYLFSQGFRYRLHDKKLPGKPDIKLSKYKTVILINGCFWHGHKNCKIYVMPKTNTDFWYSKIEKNIHRDEKNISKLRKLGWNVVVLWECQLKKKKREKTLNNLVDKIMSGNKNSI
ncbi:very short patch repair endonuclease [Zunongwangia sp. H14]|uniref:very short patch repair endonuclease n=1 Tax=Zunongwangia sp. H14 TaxID=3240792 RepID=UPI0035677A0B